MRQKGSNDETHRLRQVHHIKMGHPHNQNDEDKQRENLRGMKQWVNNLSYQSLLDALEFTFQSDSSSASESRPCGRHRRRPREKLRQQQRQSPSYDNHRSPSRNGDSGSHEFDLLMTMLSHQYPDGNTSIFHSVDWCFDWRRQTKASLESPSLFRWVNLEAMKDDGSCKKASNHPIGLDKSAVNPSASSSSSSSVEASRSKNNMPSELLDLLSQAGVKRSTASLLQTFNEIDDIDKPFETLGDCRGSMDKHVSASEDPSTPTIFTVEAYSGKFDDGTYLGKGTTFDQQRADKSILLWTALIMDKSIEAGEEGATFRCALCTGGVSTMNERQKKQILLDTLRISSRGKFLSMYGVPKYQYIAPWFDPTQQWFSLPVYLSSRFEASLWETYYTRQNNATSASKETESSLLQSMKKLSDDAIDWVLCYAISAVVKDELKQNINILDNQNTSSESIHASHLYQLLLWSDKGSMSTKMYRQPLDFALTPFLEWNTPLNRLKSRVLEYLQEGIAREAERSLMQLIPPLDFFAKPPANNNKKKKKRRTKKNCNSNQSVLRRTKKVDQSDDYQISDNDEDEEEPLVASHQLNYPPHNEKDGVKTIVVNIVHDTIHNALAKLDLENDDFNDLNHAISVKYRGECSEKDTQCPSIDKSRSADGIEVATTAVVSNRVGARVDAAMTFLQRASSDSYHCQSQVRSRQLWASRSSRQTGLSPQRKRSSSTGAGSTADKKPPIYPSKINQPSIILSSHDSLWPSSDTTLLVPQASHTETSIFDGVPLCLSGALDGWNSVARPKQNESSIFTELLKDHTTSNSEREQSNTASSTAASIATSSAASIASSGEEAEGDVRDIPDDFLAPRFIEFMENSSSPVEAIKSFHIKSISVQNGTCDQEKIAFDSFDDAIGPTLSDDGVKPPITNIISESNRDMEMSPTPFAPPTPPPQLSPIIVSLADLGKLRVELLEQADMQCNVTPKPPVRGLPHSNSLKPSLSRDDFRSIDEYRKATRGERDDHHNMGQRQIDAHLSYRNVVAQQVPRKPPSLKSFDGKQKHRDDSHPVLTKSSRSIKTTRSRARSIHTALYAQEPELDLPNSEPILNRVLHVTVACAKSESGLDGEDGASHCNVMPSGQNEDTMTKDGTTISSVHSSPVEKFASLKEERNLYRDMCLTLGAENAKLMNLLASKTCAPLYRTTLFAQETAPSYFYNQQQRPAPNSVPNQFSTQSIMAMSDAGIHRAYSAMSEDGTDFHPSVVAFVDNHNTTSWQARGDSVHSVGYRTSGCGTYADSDTSMERNLGQDSFALPRVHHHDSFFGPIPLQGVESRLSVDISRYMNSLRSQLKKAEGRRLRAVEAITKTIKALWPRAQIKLYGSHVTKLCLPSSDMDFVICLPAVHKNAPATAPGDLEGRNAINETNQKVLARKLKTESWLDQRSIKVIERTAVPVIKVSTKDVRSHVVQLDLSFDAKEHHGLEALTMIHHILEEMPMVRPLVLVLKQFLLDRGLLTAYTGGLSSYCLFLMVAKYCQEQAPIWNDCGSLLMGLLDFYGNYFNPRSTGISVRTRQYFFRSQGAHDSLQAGKFDPIWVEDPMNVNNNVGRNAFRIFQVQRAFSDAHRALVASLEWDINSTNEFDDDGEYPLLKCLLQNEDVFFSIEDNPINR